jgi:hypothetical protein
MTDPAERGDQEPAPALQPELEARLAALERAAPSGDFDRASWFWMIVLGIAIPLVLLVVGWRA